MEIAVIGGGAAGFFSALSAAQHHPSAKVSIHEKSAKVLSKVRISGGGRCNVTHHMLEARKLARNYPRGELFLRKAFSLFDVQDSIDWFTANGVPLKVEDDGRMFPVSDDSDSVVNALVNKARASGIQVELGNPVRAIVPKEKGFDLITARASSHADRVIVTVGGNLSMKAYDWLSDLGHRIVAPVPSLFTFNLPNDPIRSLMGVVSNARVRSAGSTSNGPVLITHWGLSGPAVLRLSAFAARQLADLGYRTTVVVDWSDGLGEMALREAMGSSQLQDRQAQNADPIGLPRRLWIHLIGKASVPLNKSWREVGRKGRDRIIDRVVNDRYEMIGKTTFKEEFVTAGGVDLEEVDPLTMQSKLVRGLFFAGEVLDIDGITGGFNFQAAWTTGYIAGRSLSV